MDVASWLRSLGLEQYEAAFRENAYDLLAPNLSQTVWRCPAPRTSIISASTSSAAWRRWRQCAAHAAWCIAEAGAEQAVKVGNVGKSRLQGDIGNSNLASAGRLSACTLVLGAAR